MLANSLAPGEFTERFDHTLVFLRGSSALRDRVDPRVTIIDLQYTGFKGLPALIGKLRDLFRQKNISLVHSHLNPAGWYAHLAKPANIPQVHTLHTPYSLDEETRPFLKRLERHFLFRDKKIAVISPSAFVENDFRKSLGFRGRSFVLSNFISEHFFAAKPKAYHTQGLSLKLVAAGTLKPLKNFEFLLKVFRHLGACNITLDIFGAGDATAYLQEISANGLLIRMAGPVADMNIVLPQYDLFILPSKFESFSLAAFEAMASGLPVMLSDIAPLRSLIGDNALYFPLDDIKKTAGMLGAIFSGEKNIDAYAAAGYEFASGTARLSTYTAGLTDIYSKMIA